MKLFYSPFHDFAHKVLVVAHEAGLSAELETVASFPFRNLDGEHVRGRYPTERLTPLGKVPFLALDDGRVLYASQTVCEYLDRFNRTAPLYPSDPTVRFDALRRLALGDGLFDAAVTLSMEGWRDPAERRDDLYAWLWPKIEAGFDAANGDPALDAERFDIGHAGLLQGVSYVDAWASGRDDLPGNRCRDWRERWPELAEWFAETLKRASVAAHYRQPYTGDTSQEFHASAVAEVLAARARTA